MVAVRAAILADSGLLGGPSLIVLLVLAIGAAMVVGSLGAIFRPPPEAKEGDLERAPVARSVVMAAIGFLAAVWALASLIKGV